MLNLESVKAKKPIHSSASIDLGASYPNMVLLRRRSMLGDRYDGKPCFKGSLEVCETKNIGAFFDMCLPPHYFFKEIRAYYLIFRYVNYSEA